MYLQDTIPTQHLEAIFQNLNQPAMILILDIQPNMQLSIDDGSRIRKMILQQALCLDLGE